CVGGPSWFGFVRTHPRDVDPTTFAERKLSTPDVANGDDTARLTVHLERAREAFAVLGTDVEDVAAPWVTGEVDQVDAALAVHHRLGLDTAVRNAQQDHLAC